MELGGTRGQGLSRVETLRDNWEAVCDRIVQVKWGASIDVSPPKQYSELVQLLRVVARLLPTLLFPSLLSAPTLSYVRSRGGGGASPQFTYATPPPPCPLGPGSYQGSTATGHTYGGAKDARKFFPLPT